MKKDDFGDRMKSYEFTETSHKFDPSMPIYVRIDGRGFSKFTKGMRKPYDELMSVAMIDTTKMLVDKSNALIGYTQSDEISLVFMPKENNNNILFSGKKQKMVSVLSSMATAFFHKALRDVGLTEYIDRMPHFDCRAFQLPSKTEACNALLWREIDARKNAVSLAAQSKYNHKTLQGVSQNDMIDMLLSIGVDFEKYPRIFRVGTFVKRKSVEKVMSKQELLNIPVKYRPDTNLKIRRTIVDIVDIPSFREYPYKLDLVFGSLYD